jgi:hypothetical protein
MFPSVQALLARYTPRSELGRAALEAMRVHYTHRARSMEQTRSKLKNEKLSLSVLVRVTLERLATDPRDKVYGLLGMTPSHFVLQPDYSLPVSKVYTTAMKAMLLQNKDLSTFTFLQYSDVKRMRGLPSWVVNFKTLSENRSSAAISGYFEGLSERMYSATSKTNAGTEFFCEFDNDDNELRLTGSEIDVVWTIGEFEPLPKNSMADSAQESMWSIVTQWKSYVHSMDIAYTTGETSLVAFWRTLTADRKVVGYHRGYFGQTQEGAETRLEKGDTLIPPQSLQDEKRLVKALVWHGGQMSHLWNRRFAISKKGYFALVPAATRKGDVLHVLNGGEAPYVLRPQTNGRCEMIGEWYDVKPLLQLAG